jgi:hypothetical protein
MKYIDECDGIFAVRRGSIEREDQDITNSDCKVSADEATPKNDAKTPVDSPQFVAHTRVAARI